MTRKLRRNEPCSCGSGKKYKKCCLQAQQRTADADRQRRNEKRLKRDEELDRLESSRIERERFFEELHRENPTDADARLGKLSDRIVHGEPLDSAWAIALADGILEAAARKGDACAAGFTALDLLSERHPEACSSPSAEAAVLDARVRLACIAPGADPVAEMARMLGKQSCVDQCFQLFDCLMYHGRVDGLADLMAENRARVYSLGLMSFAEYQYDEVGISLRLVEGQANAPSQRPLDLDTLEPFLDRPENDAWMGQILAAAGGATTECELWGSLGPTGEDMAETITLMSHRFSAPLYRQPAWKPARVELARLALVNLAASLQSGALSKARRRRASGRSKPLSPWLPEKHELEEILVYMVGGFEPEPHRACALCRALPIWLEWLADRGLLDRSRARKLYPSIRRRSSVLAHQVARRFDDWKLVRDFGLLGGKKAYPWTELGS